MLINGGVVVCKFFLANARQCFEMGGVIQGGNFVTTMRRWSWLNYYEQRLSS